MIGMRQKSQTGQSLIELAVATPVLIFMLFGVFNTAVMISDKVIAGSACRQGARLAAEIGGTITNPLLTTAQVDQDIVRAYEGRYLALVRSVRLHLQQVAR